MSLREITKNRCSFPSDDALQKLFFQGLRNISKKWTLPIRDWKAVLTRFTIKFDDQMNSLSPKPRLHRTPDTLGQPRHMKPASSTAPATYGLYVPSATVTVERLHPQASNYRSGKSVQTNGTCSLCFAQNAEQTM